MDNPPNSRAPEPNDATVEAAIMGRFSILSIFASRKCSQFLEPGRCCSRVDSLGRQAEPVAQVVCEPCRNERCGRVQ